MGGPVPPGETERVRAQHRIVAPHYDDEVLGCGGWWPSWRTQAQSRLFLSDSAAVTELPPDREYAEARRRESQSAAAVLGIAGSEHLGLPDGSLELNVDAATEGLRRALVAQRPDLLLAPSPLESTSDHRASFLAVHRVLGAVRIGDPLEPVVSDLRVLLYDITHAGYSDLLVDVSLEIPRLEAAMACYASQEARHPYLRAGLGLRAFRASSLTPEVRAAEGYRRLMARDFAVHGISSLIRALGGVAVAHEVTEGPRISVIVRTRNRPALLQQAWRASASSYGASRSCW